MEVLSCSAVEATAIKKVTNNTVCGMKLLVRRTQERIFKRYAFRDSP